MKKRSDAFTFFSPKFKVGHDDSQIAANIHRTWDEGSTWDQTLWEDWEVRGCLSAIYHQHLKTLVEQNPHQSVRKMSQLIGVSI